MLTLPKFEDALDVTPLPDGRWWKVLSPFYYDTDVALTPTCPSPQLLNRLPTGGWRIIVNAGFVTDFASIPQVFWNLLPPTGRYSRAAVIHDLLYRTPGLCTRAEADAVLLEAMRYPCQVDWFTRTVIWLGVRLGGWIAWRTDQRRTVCHF